MSQTAEITESRVGREERNTSVEMKAADLVGAPQPVTRPAEVPPVVAARWPSLKFVTPLLVVSLAAALIVTLTANWNLWEGGRAEQATDDASVRGDLTPLSTKVAGIVRDVKVADYQQVHKGDLLFELQDDDYQAQVAQATAAVEAAKAAIGNNVRQRSLQDARIDRAKEGIDQANAQIAAAQAGISAAQADVARTALERQRQEALLATQSSTKQHVETAVADQQRFAAQEASRSADLQEAKTGLRSNEIAVEAERRSKAVLESQEQQLFADLQAKEAALAVTKINLGYTKIFAPVTGTVSVRAARQGEVLNVGQPICTIVDFTDTWVRAALPETQADHIGIGDALKIRLPGGTITSGKVFYKSAEADFATQRDVNRRKRDIKTIVLKVRLDNPKGAYVPGMTAEVLVSPDQLAGKSNGPNVAAGQQP